MKLVWLNHHIIFMKTKPLYRHIAIPLELGFSLIELTIVIGIIAAISTIAITSFSSITKRADLNGNAQNIITTLNTARSKTISSDGASQWGGHFETDKYALFKGTVYNAGDPNTKIYTLPSSLEISTIALNGGGTDTIFDRITGKTSNYGTVTIREKNQPTNLINISIENSGQSSATAPNQLPAGTRLADSRHIHFTYSSNVQNAATLIIEFPAYSADNKSVAFQDYLNAAKDSFDWTESIVVNGVSRTIKIHTHSLNASQAVFSVHRDRENNVEEMKITLDGQNLLNYAATTGLESKGTSNWVSVPEKQ